MKAIFLGMILIFTSCANSKKVVDEAQKIPPKTLVEKKQKIRDILSNHDELNKEQKSELESLLINSIEKLETLRQKESQLIQQILNKTLVNKGTYHEIVALKKALKEVYTAKYENFASVTTEVKKIVGIKTSNSHIAQDIAGMDFLRE